ncbi:hypothetical protein [Streptomyces sp. NRRL S-87]|uniref:hypothetical protein n=1 Tax=Streptomyces sp. NRRL S-87 TaxID=1463920 RepID=UPI0004C18899|nr:hypothetical protein [Streptomyces sp. NRRL S-87]
MSRSLRRGALAAAATVLSIGSLAACGAGSNAQTLEIKPDNAAVTKGEIQVQNALVITQPEHDAKGPAAVSATLFNNGVLPQTLDAVSVPGGGGEVKLKAADGSGKIVVPAGGSVVLGGKGNPSAIVETPRGSLKDGAAQKVVFRFSRTGYVQLGAFVVPAKSYFSDYGPTELPELPAAGASASPAASGTPSGSPSGSPSGKASGTPGGHGSGTPSGSASHGAGH